MRCIKSMRDEYNNEKSWGWGFLDHCITHWHRPILQWLNDATTYVMIACLPDIWLSYRVSSSTWWLDHMLAKQTVSSYRQTDKTMTCTRRDGHVTVTWHLDGDQRITRWRWTHQRDFRRHSPSSFEISRHFVSFLSLLRLSSVFPSRLEEWKRLPPEESDALNLILITGSDVVSSVASPHCVIAGNFRC